MVSASALESWLAHHRSDNLASNIFQQAPLNPLVVQESTWHSPIAKRRIVAVTIFCSASVRDDAANLAPALWLLCWLQGTKGPEGSPDWPVLARSSPRQEIVERKQNNQIQLVLCLLPRDSASISTVSLFYTPSHHPVIHHVYLLTVIHQSYPPRPWPLPSFKLGSSRDLRSWWNWTSSRMPCAWSMAALGIKKEKPWLWDISQSLIYIYNIGMYA